MAKYKANCMYIACRSTKIRRRDIYVAEAISYTLTLFQATDVQSIVMKCRVWGGHESKLEISRSNMSNVIAECETYKYMSGEMTTPKLIKKAKMKQINLNNVSSLNKCLAIEMAYA